MKTDNIIAIDLSPLYQLQHARLGRHPLYSAIHDESYLAIFMEHHVYAVWDFMCLIKALQSHIAPAGSPWIPPGNSRHANFINQLVTEEESDNALVDTEHSTHASHFESYCRAMVEVGASTRGISQFVQTVRDSGLAAGLRLNDIPDPSRQFMSFTFDIIGRNQPHLLAAILAYGRETLVPGLFRSLIKGLQAKRNNLPYLYGYLERHIQLDEQEHGPIAMQMVQELCDGSSEKLSEVVEVAEQALAARLNFWNGIHTALTS